jgi:cell wall-associated NlpC family hydrolase
MSQQGKPYVWGAAGPDSYDCSGLTMWAWAQAGVSLPHQSAEQQALGTPVSQGQLQPGDLVFFGSPAYHVGMYIGNGMMVHAPTTGDVVKVSPLAYMSDYSGATRVG